MAFFLLFWHWELIVVFLTSVSSFIFKLTFVTWIRLLAIWTLKSVGSQSFWDEIRPCMQRHLLSSIYSSPSGDSPKYIFEFAKGYFYELFVVFNLTTYLENYLLFLCLTQNKMKKWFWLFFSFFLNAHAYLLLSGSLFPKFLASLAGLCLMVLTMIFSNSFTVILCATLPSILALEVFLSFLRFLVVFLALLYWSVYWCLAAYCWTSLFWATRETIAFEPMLYWCAAVTFIFYCDYL